MKRSERTPGLDPEILDELQARVLVALERFRLSPRPVERKHQLAAEPLAERIRPRRTLQFADDLGGASFGKVAFDPLLEAGEAELLQTRDLGLSKALIRELGQRWPPPKSQCLVEPSLLLDALEVREIELPFREAKAVARRPRLQPFFPEQLPKLRDVHLQRLLRRLGRVVLPERFDQAASRDNVVRLKKQHRQKRALLRPAQLERMPVHEHLERAKDPELQRIRGRDHHAPVSLRRRLSGT